MILLDKMTTKFFQVFLIGSKLLDLPTNHRVYCGVPPIVKLNLVLLVLSYLASYVLQEVFGSFFEVLVGINVITISVAYFAEAVHVELAYEGCKIAVFEIGWQYFFCEPAYALNDKTIS